jgi:peptidoglycan/LPS O-acetylase OafA/YrhL
VISGFLMAGCLLSSSFLPPHPPSSSSRPTKPRLAGDGWRASVAAAGDFYRRRFNRIVPSAAAVLCGAIGIGRCLFLDSDFARLRVDLV